MWNCIPIGSGTWNSIPHLSLQVELGSTGAGTWNRIQTGAGT